MRDVGVVVPAWLARNHAEGRGFFWNNPAPINRYARHQRGILFRGYARGPRVTAERLLQARRYPRRRPRHLGRATLLRSLHIAVMDS